jgi:hypothetical protein
MGCDCQSCRRGLNFDCRPVEQYRWRSCANSQALADAGAAYYSTLVAESVRHSPELKEVFSGAGTVAKTLAKEQAGALSAEESALGKIKSQLANPTRIRS